MTRVIVYAAWVSEAERALSESSCQYTGCLIKQIYSLIWGRLVAPNLGVGRACSPSMPGRVSSLPLPAAHVATVHSWSSMVVNQSLQSPPVSCGILSSMGRVPECLLPYDIVALSSKPTQY